MSAEQAQRIPKAVLEAIANARHVCVLTGAGASAESGVPTFRDAREGLWAEFDPLQLATPEGFLRDPALVWRWYRWRRELVAEVEPNPGHRALAELQRVAERLTLVTQNVDGLHQAAGSEQVIEFHGNLFADRCFDKDCSDTGCAESAALPRCKSCGGLLRPGVVWFGEAIPEDALEDSFSAAASCDVYLSVGTASEVFPAAGLLDIARGAGAVTVEINPNATERSHLFDFALRAKSGQALPELLNSLAA